MHIHDIGVGVWFLGSMAALAVLALYVEYRIDKKERGDR